jgi:uncharacterized protein YdaU (DUF1376 family)
MSKHKTTFESPWWYKQVPRDFMSSTDVLLMTAEEIGSFFLLLQCSWLAGADCTLPNDPEKLAKLARVERISEIVLSKFSLDKQGRLFNERLSQEWQEALRRSKDGKKAVSARWKKPYNGNTTVSPSNNESTTTNTNTNTHTNTNKSKDKDTQAHASNSDSSEAPSAPSNPTPPGAAAKTCAETLAKLLGRNNLKPATKEAWAEQAQKLLARHDEQTLTAMMHWALTNSGDSFWRGRLLSMKHFVRSFKTIHQQFNSGQQRATGEDPLAQRAASLNTGHDFSALAKGDV